MIVCARYPPPLSRDSPVIVEMDISIAWVLDKVMGSGVSIIRRREGAKSVGIEGEACRRQALRPVRKHSVPEGLPSASRPVPCCAACWRARSRRRGAQRQAFAGGKTRGWNVRVGRGEEEKRESASEQRQSRRQLIIETPCPDVTRRGAPPLSPSRPLPPSPPAKQHPDRSPTEHATLPPTRAPISFLNRSPTEHAPPHLCRHFPQGL